MSFLSSESHADSLGILRASVCIPDYVSTSDIQKRHYRLCQDMSHSLHFIDLMCRVGHCVSYGKRSEAFIFGFLLQLYSTHSKIFQPTQCIVLIQLHIFLCIHIFSYSLQGWDTWYVLNIYCLIYWLNFAGIFTNFTGFRWKKMPGHFLWNIFVSRIVPWFHKRPMFSYKEINITKTSQEL